jgi:hypothetical protein
MKYETTLYCDRGPTSLRLWADKPAEMWITKEARECQELDWKTKNISQMI